ncbi:nitrogen regulation protein NR(II) [Alteromonas sediminis]|uniref:Sensory histidine kinase/phosphatase NtrB n=1 Tax=Alteromonas sediminis TaxID=2259342 RepID=A0A3N5YAH6_9ALTE|nr:nitrogen regulation protein NR(II) [Alteromonas sediminis]RPJ65785.1 nitrogen regulation protein NR(II) [Alteromonas sediminis]
MCEADIELTALLDSLHTAIVVVNESLHIQYANHAGLALFETGFKQLCDHPLTDFFRPETINASRLKAALRKGEDFTENEVTLLFKEQRMVLADLTVTNMRLKDEPMLMFEVKKVDKQKRISRENQQNAQHFAARELIRGLAHEIKNPLGGIRGAAQLLEKELSPQQAEFTQLIVEQSDRLRALVDRLLGPNSLPTMQWCNIHEAIEKVRTLISAEVGNKIQVIRDYDPSIPMVCVDTDMIQQAVLNIARNSIQAIKQANINHPKIRLVTRVDRQVTIHGERYPLVAKVKVIDNGPGIPLDIRDTLFYPMVTTKENGSGLGLSIAQTLVNHHSGKIDVESRPGFTAFVLYLPIKKQEQPYE